MNLLPKWRLTGALPSVNDFESATAIEMVAKVYNAMNGLINEYNEFADQINKDVSNFTESGQQEIANFKESVEERIRCKFNDLDASLAKIKTDLVTYTNDYLATVPALPVVSASDNAKFMSVVNGTWAAVYLIDKSLKYPGMAADAAETGKKITEIAARLNNLLGRISEGSTTMDAELMDICVGANGETYDCAGDAVRGQFLELKEGVDNSLKKSTTVLVQRNIVNLNNLTVGNYVSRDGSLGVNEGYSVSDYELVSPGTVYSFWRWEKNSAIGQTAFYDKKKNYIDGSYAADIHEVTAPMNAHYIRFSGMTSLFSVDSTPILCAGTVNTGDTVYQNEYVEKHEKYLKAEDLRNNINTPDFTYAESISQGKLLSIDCSDAKKNNVIGFEAKFESMGSVRIAHGLSYDSNRSASITVDDTNVILYYGENSPVETYPHGLTMKDIISISVIAKENGTADVILCTNGDRFVKNDLYWHGCRESIVARVEAGTFTDAKLSWYVPDYNKDLWIFGDSYFDFWGWNIIGLGYSNFYFDGYGGRGSAEAYESLEKALEHCTPKKILWCMGMNDVENGAINEAWKTAFDNLIGISEENGIELIACTIPSTPLRTHNFKNEYIKASGKRYVDIERVVGADISVNWYDGMLADDNIHPTPGAGTKTIANAMIVNVPELIK